MARTWELPVASSDAQRVREGLTNAALAEQSEHRGSGQPSYVVAGQTYSDSDDDRRHFHDGTSDHVIEQQHVAAYQGAASASVSRYVHVPHKVKVIEVVATTDTATTSDASNHWGFEVYDRTASLSLFAAIPNTNGSELVAHTARIEAVGQNDVIDAGSTLEVRLIATGTPTSLANVAIGITTQRVWNAT